MSVLWGSLHPFPRPGSQFFDPHMFTLARIQLRIETGTALRVRAVKLALIGVGSGVQGRTCRDPDGAVVMENCLIIVASEERSLYHQEARAASQ